MKELGEALQTIFAKIGDFFDILDLSFLISGAAVLGAVWFWADSYRVVWPALWGGGITLVVLFVASYWSGMICFAIGRWLRGLIFRPKKYFEEPLLKILESHGLSKKAPYKDYIGKNSHELRYLYNRMWAELREAAELTNSMALCRRYWVMAATYDGVGFAALVWFFTLLFCRFNPMPAQPASWPNFILLEVIFGLAFIFCLREAGRYKINQIEELAASLALPKKH